MVLLSFSNLRTKTSKPPKGLTTDIRPVDIESEKAFIFDMQGNRLDNMRKGVNIIRTKDGKTKKIVVK